MDQPMTRLVTVLAVGFIDGTEHSLTLEASDGWHVLHGDIVIDIAAKPERHVATVDERGRSRVITVRAQRSRSIRWFRDAIKWVEHYEAEAVEHAAYVPPSATPEAQ